MRKTQKQSSTQVKRMAETEPRPEKSDSIIVHPPTYRVEFSCENTGRYIRRSKRRIRWVFGFYNIDVSNQRGHNGRGEEHEVELIWSVKSGKTRILWNKYKISSTIREGGKSEVLEFTWKTQSGEVLKVVAHSSITVGVDRQYDLLINGVSFFQLPTISELHTRNNKSKSQETRADESVAKSISSCDSFGSFRSSDFPQEITVPSSSSSSFRLTMAGFQSESQDDELRSELYSSSLDEVRLSVTSFLPQTDEMISRAIMDAFICDDETDNNSSSSSFCVPHNEECCQLEVNALCEALEWTRQQSSNTCRQDVDEMALVFMQKLITRTFSHIRSEQISSQTAIRILLGVAALLGLQFSRRMVQDTVIIEDVSGDMDRTELRDYLSTFGSLDRFSVSKLNPTFTLCRYVDEAALVALLQAVQENKLPRCFSLINWTTLSNNIASSTPSTTEESSSNEAQDDDMLDQNDGISEILTPPHMIKLVAHKDLQITPSTCFSSQSLSSLLDFSPFIPE